MTEDDKMKCNPEGIDIKHEQKDIEMKNGHEPTEIKIDQEDNEIKSKTEKVSQLTKEHSLESEAEITLAGPNTEVDNEDDTDLNTTNNERETELAENTEAEIGEQQEAEVDGVPHTELVENTHLGRVTNDEVDDVDQTEVVKNTGETELKKIMHSPQVDEADTELVEQESNSEHEIDCTENSPVNLRPDPHSELGGNTQPELEAQSSPVSEEKINDKNATEQDILMKKEKQQLDPKIKKQQELIKIVNPSSELEIALSDELVRKESHISRLSGEIAKLKTFISKRKQTYKRKRKDQGAPTRALSAYNIFVQDRFSRLAKENEAALKSADTDAQLKRVPPASLVASTGNQWKELSNEEKEYYEDRARHDRKRYDQQMTNYQPPDKQFNRKRNKTGYNMFFSAHVLRLKQSEAGVPSERGSVARLVGNAWKDLTSEDKQYYEREADKQNGANSENEVDHGELKEKEEMSQEYPQVHAMLPMDAMHRSSHQLSHPAMVHQPSHHDHRGHYPPPPHHGHPPPPHYQGYPGYYDYSHSHLHPHQPHPGQPQGRNGGQHGGYHYPPPHYPHYTEQGQPM